MRDDNRSMVNPFAIGIAAVIGAAAAWLFSSDENKQKARRVYHDLKGKAEDFMESTTKKAEDIKDDMKEEIKTKAAAGRRRIMNTPPDSDEDI